MLAYLKFHNSKYRGSTSSTLGETRKAAIGSDEPGPGMTSGQEVVPALMGTPTRAEKGHGPRGGCQVVKVTLQVEGDLPCSPWEQQQHGGWGGRGVTRASSIPIVLG